MIKRNNYCPLLLFMLTALLLSGGCSKEQQTTPSPPAHHVKAKKITPPVLEEHSSAQKTGSPVPYPPSENTSRKDPFKPFVVIKPHAEKSIGTVKTADLLPIQSYETAKFKVSGIIVGLKENRALVIDPAGKGYVVKQGMLIGDSDGRIERITPTSIEVLEKFRDDNGQIKSRTVKLTLPQKK